MQNVLDNSSVDHYGFINNGLKAVNKDHVGREKVYKISQNVSSNGGINNLFQGSTANITFLLPIGQANVLDVTESIVLELTIENNDGANAASLLAGHFLLNNVQTLTNGILEQSFAESQMIRRLFLANNDQEIENMTVNENFSYSFAAGYGSPTSTIPASGSKKIYLQIFTPIDVSQVFLPAITQQISIQLYFNSTAVISSSASTNVSVSNARLIMNGFAYENQIRQAKLQLFAQKPHYYGTTIIQREVLSGISVSNVNASSFATSAFSSFKLPCLFLLLRAANATQENLYAFDKIQTLDERINGKSVYLSELDNQEFVRMLLDAGIKSSVPNSATNILCLPHSVDIFESLRDNKQKGTLMYNPNISQIITTSSAVGVRDLIAIGFQACALKIDRGTLSLEYL